MVHGSPIASSLESRALYIVHNILLDARSISAHELTTAEACAFSIDTDCCLYERYPISHVLVLYLPDLSIHSNTFVRESDIP